jgi:hypothetical protein
MSIQETKVLKCVNCGRTIAECAVCDERDCPPPLCNHCVTMLLVRSQRPQFEATGVSIGDEGILTSP